MNRQPETTTDNAASATAKHDSAEPESTPGLFNRDDFFSSPLIGRPVVHWTHGSTDDIICEFWPEWDSPEQSQRSFMFSVALEKKWIIYSKNEPGLRAVILLGDADKSGNADQSSHTDHWQPVVKIGLETSGGLDWDAYVRQGKKLFAEFCRIRRPGRPVGTGRPLKPADEGAEAHEFDLRHFYDKLDAAGFTEMERETLMTYFQVGSQVRASKILKITPPALFKRLNRLDAKFKKAFGEHIPRRFSNRHITDTGERRNRKRTFDGSKNYFTPKEPPDPFEDIRFKNEPAE